MGNKANARASMGKKYKPRKEPHNHVPLGKTGYVPETTDKPVKVN